MNMRDLPTKDALQQAHEFLHGPPLPPRIAARRLAAGAIRSGFRPEALHAYTDLDGTALHWRIRLKNQATGEKWIRPMRVRGMVYDLSEPVYPRGKLLYRLHDLATGRDDVVVVTEGEYKADKLAALGLTVTTSGSADSAVKADWQPLAGREVLIWPDHDEAGQRYADAVAAALAPLGCTVRVLDVAALGLQAKGDAADWLALHPDATAPEVLALACVPTRAIEPQGDGQGWPEPSPLPDALSPVKAFNYAMLPDGLRQWVDDIALRMQCPPDFAAVGAIIAASALIGARALVQPKAQDDWRVTPNLWGVVVGRPATMKSPALKEVLRPIRRIEAQRREAHAEAMTTWHAEQKFRKVKAGASEGMARAAIKKGNETEARTLLAEDEDVEAPDAPRVATNDPTVPALCEVMRANPWGMLLERDELYGFLKGMDREGNESDRTFYLTAADGDSPYTEDRIGRGLNLHLPRVCLSILGGIQPGRLSEYVRGAMEGGAGDDGLIQRFQLAVWPDSDPEWRDIDQWPDTPARQAANAVFDRLAALPDPQDEAPAWRFDAEAQATFKEWRADLEHRLRGETLHPAMESHLAKYRKLVPALALIFALIDTPRAGSIAEPELVRALQWVEYLETHAARIYGAGLAPEVEGAVRLLSRIKSRALGDANGEIAETFTARQVAQKGWAGLADVDAVRKVADVLIEANWLRIETVHSADPKGRGRPSETYAINPAAWASA